MAEAVGTALAVVGVLGQLFDGCVRAYGHFAAAAGFEGDARRLGCKVRIEEMRLLVWGRHWGVAEGRLEARLLRDGGDDDGGGGVGGPALRRLALQILTELHQTITDVQRLRDRYGLALGGGGDDDAKGGPSPHRALAVRPAANGTKPAKTGERSWRQELATRTKWVVAGTYRRASLSLFLPFWASPLSGLRRPAHAPLAETTSSPLTLVADKDKFTSLLGDLKGTPNTQYRISRAE